MAARRTNKNHVIRQTTGERYPAAVVGDASAENALDEKAPAPAETATQDDASLRDGLEGEEGAAVAAVEMDDASEALETEGFEPSEVEHEAGQDGSAIADIVSDVPDARAIPSDDAGAAGQTGMQEDLFDLFSQSVTGSPVMSAEPEPGDGVGFSMPVEDLASMEDVEAEPEGLADDADGESSEADTDMDAAIGTFSEDDPGEGIDESFIEAGAPNGSAPLLDAQMFDEQLDVSPSNASDGSVSSAEASILMLTETQNAVLTTIGTRDDILSYARVAGIMAGKRAGELVPSCPAQTVSECAVDIHPIAGSGANVLRGWRPTRKDGRAGFYVQATCSSIGSTNAQTAALTAVSAACLTIFDMVEDDDATMEVVDLRPLLPERPAISHVAMEEAEEEGIGEEEAAEEKIVPASPLPGGAGTGQPAPAIAFVGFQNSGKTTLVERVISNLTKRGLRIGSIKLYDPKGFEIDQPGKDSWRHAQAGSRHVGLISPDQYAEYASTTSEVPVQDLLTHYTDVDLVIVEGLKTTGIPSIVVARSGVDRIRGISSYDLIDDDTLAIACNEVTARGIRSQWDKMRTDDEMANPDLPLEPPAFLDINDVPEIVSFVMDYLKGE